MRSRALVIYAYGGGRFGNQLLRFLHWAAWALEHQDRCSVHVLPFWPYSDLFTAWRRNPGCVVPFPARFADDLARLRRRLPVSWQNRIDWPFQRLVARGARNLGRLGVHVLDNPAEARVDLENPGFLDRAQAGRALVCTGWEYTCWSFLSRHEKEIRQLFTPAPEYLVRAEAFLRELRREYDLVFGLFVRRGDYRDFFDGRFYHSWEDYARWATEALDLHPGKRICFVVAGDECVPPDAFAGLPIRPASGSINRGGHWFSSFLELSLCDVILGPPSTFAACAAFLGDRPWWPLRSTNQSLRTDQILGRALFQAAEDPELALSVR